MPASCWFQETVLWDVGPLRMYICSWKAAIVPSTTLMCMTSCLAHHPTDPFPSCWFSESGLIWIRPTNSDALYASGSWLASLNKKTAFFVSPLRLLMPVSCRYSYLCQILDVLRFLAPRRSETIDRGKNWLLFWFSHLPSIPLIGL